jgi:hypothetical protein
MIKIQKQSGVLEYVDSLKLVSVLMGGDFGENKWRKECVIITDYMPPCPNENTRPKCVVHHPLSESFLRYSKGPHQGFFWDVYGEDFQCPELALLALSQVQRPHGKPYFEFRIPLKPTKGHP